MSIIHKTLNLLQKKCINFYETQKIKCSKDNIEIISKIIFFFDRNNKKCNLLNIEDEKFIEEVIIYSFQNYKISLGIVKNTIKALIEKSKLNIINILYENNLNYLKDLLDDYLIRENDLFNENCSISKKILFYLIEKNYFKSLNDTKYSKSVLNIYEDISNRILDLTNISYKMLKIINKEDKKILEFLSMNNTNIMQNLDKYISKIEEVINMYNKSLLFLETIKFSCFDTLKERIKKCIEYIQNKIINSIEDINNYIPKINSFMELVACFCEKVFTEHMTNFFSKIISLDPKTNNLDSKFIDALKILFCENIDVDLKYDEYIILIFLALLKMNNKEKDLFIKYLYECFLIYKDILKFDFIEMKKDIENQTEENQKIIENSIFEKYLDEIKNKIL